MRLASAPHRVWTREELAELFWPGEYGEVARDRLRQTLAVLNKALRETGGDSPILGTKTQIRFNASQATVDTEEFALLLGKAKFADSNEARAAALQQAIVLAQGPFASGFVEDWVQAIRDEIAGRVHEAKIELAEILCELERSDEAQRILQEATHDRPLSDRANALRARLYRDTGRLGDAATVAKDYRARLKAELGLEPNAQWEELFEEGLPVRSSVQALPVTERQIRWLHVAQPITRFFGRDRELEWLSNTFSTEGYRLVTITGPGGSGKTRLSVEFGSRLAPVEASILGIGLAEFDEAGLVPHALAEAIGLQTAPGSDVYRELSQALANRKVWIVLDNCEHLMPEIADVAQRLLSAIPNAGVICTSRVLLGILGERELALLPLEAPPVSASLEKLLEYPSVDMLVERIQASRPDYRLTEEEAPIVAELSEKLEGIPLAIELAASRGSVLSTSDMLAAIDSKLDFLSSKYVNLPPRHRAMRSALEWSFAELDPDQRGLALFMSVFAGSWPIEAAAFVTNDPLVADTVQELKARSLLQADASEKEIRFRMLEVVRQFAQELMTVQEILAATTAHQRYIASVCEDLHKFVDSADRAVAVRRFRQILPDYRIACSALLKHLPENRELILPLLMKPVELCEAVGILAESSKRLEIAIEKQPYEGEDLTILKAIYGISRSFLNDIAGLSDLIPTLIAEVRKPVSLRTKFVLVNNLSDMIWQADIPAYSEELIPYLQEIIDEFEEERLQAILHLNIGNCWHHLGQQDKALQSYHTAIELAKSSGALRTLAHTYRVLNILHRNRGDAIESLSIALLEIETILQTEDLLSLSAAMRGFIASCKACHPDTRSLRDIAILAGFEKTVRRRGGGQVMRIEGSGFSECIQHLQDSLNEEFETACALGESLSEEDALHLAKEVFDRLSVIAP